MNLLLFPLAKQKLLCVLAGIMSVVLVFLSNTQAAYSVAKINLKNSDSNVIEFIRLRVASRYKNAWLNAERESWGPWLKEKKGFLSRQLFWDPEREEALLLISWASRKDWKSIPQADIESVQKLFEEISIDSLEKETTNPFPITAQGELIPQ